MADRMARRLVALATGDVASRPPVRRSPDDERGATSGEGGGPAPADDHVVRTLYTQGLLSWGHDVAVADGWPADVRERIARLRADAVSRALAQAALLTTLRQEAEHAGIPLMVLKGIALSTALYGDLARRHSVDLDVLVSPVHAGTIAGVLRGLGFVPGHPWQDGGSDEFTRWARLHHEFAFTDARGRVVELHARLTGPLMGRSRPFEALWHDRREVRLGSCHVAMPSWEDSVPHLAVHGFCHGWERLSWIADIAAIATRADVDWDRTRTLAGELRCVTAVEAALGISHALFDTPLPWRPGARADRATRAVVTRIERGRFKPPFADWLGDHFRSRDGWIDVARHAWALWRVPAADDASPGEWPPSALSLTWRRPLRLVRRHVIRGTRDAA